MRAASEERSCARRGDNPQPCYSWTSSTTSTFRAPKILSARLISYPSASRGWPHGRGLPGRLLRDLGVERSCSTAWRPRTSASCSPRTTPTCAQVVVPRDCVAAHTPEKNAAALRQIREVLKARTRLSAGVRFVAPRASARRLRKKLTVSPEAVAAKTPRLVAGFLGATEGSLRAIGHTSNGIDSCMRSRITVKGTQRWPIRTILLSREERPRV
jgi:hypothetical protein